MNHTFRPLTKEPAYLKVYNAVEREILSGALAVGSTLPTETELCQQFEVTRATVREGLRLLEQADLVVRGAAKRFYVKRPAPSDVAASTSKSLALGGVSFREVWEALLIHYPGAMTLAAERFSEDNLIELQHIHSSLKDEKANDHRATVEGAVAFFDQLATGLENRVLLALLQSLNLLIGISLTRVIAKTPNARGRIIDAQANIISALQSRNSNDAVSWMAKHINDLKQGYDVAGVSLDDPVA